ncbi:MAG TPA: prenyltransferase/squalene oxidase repeat-containing protein [Planctomycetota bacterium]|nr:prenyltransferase/squalene oxidase repeat-containing protein [Planctomycetota bacterium]
MKTMALAVMAVAALGGIRPAAADELRKPLLETYEKAADWLIGQQDASGAWKMGPPDKAAPSPAYTGLILTGLAGAPAELKAKLAPAADKAAAYLASRANPDGSFGEGPSGSFMKTYTTGIALMALAGHDPQKHAGIIRGAQAYLKNNQLKEGAFKGGLGYGDEKPRFGKDGSLEKVVPETLPNLSVTGFAADGLKMSGLPKDDAFWKLVVEFVRKCQNSTEVNTDPAFVASLKERGLSVGSDGGLYYAPINDPAQHKAGTKKIADKEVIQSYGAMTYDGIKTYLYAGLAKDSPEVQAAMDWVRKNYTVDVHPGFAFDQVQRHHLRGVYHYYMVMARALDAYGEPTIETFDGKKREWAKDLGQQLLKTAKDAKMWQNENPAWYEGDPVLTTSYVLSTLDILFRYIK